MPASWVTADEVDGGDPAPRVWLEDRGMSYVPAVRAPSRVSGRFQGDLSANVCVRDMAGV